MHAMPFAAALLLGSAVAAAVTLASPEAKCPTSHMKSGGKSCCKSKHKGHGEGKPECCKPGADCCKPGAECCEGGTDGEGGHCKHGDGKGCCGKGHGGGGCCGKHGGDGESCKGHGDEHGEGGHCKHSDGKGCCGKGHGGGGGCCGKHGGDGESCKGHGDDDCCKPGADCCKPGAECCKGAHRNHGEAEHGKGEPGEHGLMAPHAGLELPEPAPSEERADTGSKSVHFGVVLVSYAGAQDAERGARSKADAEALAQRLHGVAQSDFAAAVAQGDSGSVADAGKMGRGVLEPEVERELFSLPPGAVSKVVSTPRGFWIMKRID